ncbi:Asp-tRNA(Asn)/Glu-tRNA(Gln) amidotransferase subunit GatA [Candidatus Peregrinibacteria bacterium]|jgi:aspartyl-tRNA(Asn)/glutamyl-tRNA(Gln) amidotransferase subunit A|nr:Asp-tRNA(Asn)/Glu-tRNA(Gln) amidotransferase subunit GatA [Candidatus Peregrinibacteria bacterium]MBT4056099.1 Asp-tRNA(Asn)/Glu-tRNA(Gln) amidotransferase subunit GatA [Candidatus Peregrinibacteria bacterium]
MSDLNKLTIKEVADGLRSKKFSSEDVMKDCLARIDERNGDLNAFVTVDSDGALEGARLADKRLAAGEDDGVLMGVPMALKDLFNTAGVRTTCCSPGLKEFVPPYNATVVDRLSDAGAVMVGKTNMDEFACGASCEYGCFGAAKNPHDLTKVAGGSSGGSVVAVADDMSIFALGTDTGGSIRQPSSFCGTYGLKVTYGRVSRSGVTAFASSWDTIGPIGKSVEDISYVLQAIAGQDRRDMTTPPVKVPDYTGFLGKGVKGMKIGLPKEYFGEGVEKETRDVVMEAVGRLEKAGAEVVEVSLPMTKYAVAVYYVCAPAELSANMERYDGIRYGSLPSKDGEDLVDHYFKQRGEGFGDEVKRRIMIGTYVLSAGYMDAYYKHAMKVRTLIIKDFNKAFEKVDVLVGPVSPFPAFGIGDKAEDPVAMYTADSLTIPASCAGVPSLACPAGVSADGLPIGLQIIAPQFEEGRCLQVGEMV